MIGDPSWFTDNLYLIREWNSIYIGANLTDYTMEHFSNVTIDVNRADRAWNWLICTEFGFY